MAIAYDINGNIIDLAKGLRSKNDSDRFSYLKVLSKKPLVGAKGLIQTKIPDLASPKSEGVNSNNHILSYTPNLYNQNGVSMSSNIFIKLNRCESTFWLMANHPTAYLLLNLIALRAVRTPNHPSGLVIGEALIGDYKAIGTTRQKYRTALSVLKRLNYITIIETCRTRKNSTQKTTTTGTKVKILSSDIWDINEETTNHPINHRPTTDQPPTNHEQERKERKELEETNGGCGGAGAPDSFLLENEKNKNLSNNLDSEKQKHFEILWEFIVKNSMDFGKTKNKAPGIKQKDLIIWLEQYETTEVKDCLVMTLDCKPTKTWPGYCSKLLKDKISKKNSDSVKGRQLVEDLVKKHNMKHIDLKKEYFSDSITGEQMYYFIPQETIYEYLKRSFERSKEYKDRQKNQKDYEENY